METITFLNLKVEGTPITKITRLVIQNRIHTYGKAVVEGETDYEAGSQFVKKAQPGMTITVSTTAAGQPKVLFLGVIANAGIRKMGEYALLELNLTATASRLHIKRNHKSYQNTGYTYEKVVNQALDGHASLNMLAHDHATGKLIMQYNETDWAFAQRMASALDAPISANVDTAVPVITIGVPKTGKSYELSSAEYGFSDSGAQQGGLPDGGFAGTKLTGTQAVQLGDKIEYGGASGVVLGYESDMRDGTLKTTADVMSEAAAQAASSGAAGGSGGFLGGSGGGMQIPQITNTQASGKMFQGIVQAVKLDQVQVHLTDIDSEYDGGGDVWFPYSTAYSSSDGSGFYCMPEIGDQVRVFFPSDNEKDAFAASSVNVSPLENPKHKKWRSPAGKEILMTEEGIFITCNENKIFINLTNEDGIAICCEKDISVNSKANLTSYAKNEIKMQADHKVLISAGESFIDMTKELIQLGGRQIMIN